MYCACTGLKLRVKSSPEKEFVFDYMSAPFSLSLRAVSWVDISCGEATYTHIRLHTLTGEDSLSFFMSMLSSIPSTLAVVLVNTHDGYELSQKLTSSDNEQGCPVPMVIVTKETGREIARLVEENAQDVEAMMEVVTAQSSPSLSSPGSRGTNVYTYTMYMYMYMYAYTYKCILVYNVHVHVQMYIYVHVHVI